jgi:hypothetical protein
MMTGTLFLDHMGLCIRVHYDVICANAVWKRNHVKPWHANAFLFICETV